ncbi:MAG: LysE family translocator [Actinomycetales bacterium]
MNHLAAFVLASFLFIQVPGPSLLFTIGRALTQGRRTALLSVVGNALGLLVQVIAVAVGLGAIVAASAHAYSVLKIAGACYVVWLGIQSIRHRKDARVALEQGVHVPEEGILTALRTGFVVGSTNPKTIVFFGAFLPQFASAQAGSLGWQLFGLGAIFAAIAVTSDSVWALVAGRARSWFLAHPKRLDHLGLAGGTMMIGLGGALVAAE